MRLASQADKKIILCRQVKMYLLLKYVPLTLR